MTFDAKPVDPLSPTAAARKAMVAVNKLDALLDSIRPAETEAHPHGQLGQAWDRLLGTVARASLRADELVEAVTPLYKRLGADSSGPPPGVCKATLNGNGGVRERRIEALLARPMPGDF